MMNAVLALRDVKGLLEKQGLVTGLSDLVKSDFARWTRAIAAAKIKAD